MANITIGSLTLTDANAPKVNIKNDYYTSDSNAIIGGKRVITISGIVSVSDDGSTTAATVMSELKKIRNIGRNPKCVNVDIPPFYTGKARLQSVNIEQGSDPSWINVGGFTLTIEAPLDSIPQNGLGVVAQDNIKSLTFSEKIEVGEDAHGFVYTDDNQLSKAYVKFSCKVSVEIDPICKNINNRQSLEDIIRRFMKTAPSHKLLNKYKNWRVYAQDRTYELSSTNSASFNLDAILLSPASRGAVSYVDLNFKHNRTYSSGEETKTISGNIKGLVSIPWSDIFSIQGLSSASKMDNAESTFTYIKNFYGDITSWDGIEYELNFQNCNSNNANLCLLSTTPNTNARATKIDCIKPYSSTVSRSRTEGSVDFTFDWVNNDCAKNNPNTITIEYAVDDQKSQPSIQEFTIPTVGILLQNLQCYTARKITFSSSVNLPAGSCLGAAPPCIDQYNNFDIYISKYFASRSLSQTDYMLVDFTKTETLKSNTIKKSYISVCLTEVT